ncbi:S-adenosyl-L-methionine-dependent methyltransferase [Pyrenochaeta sp. DS3sAY3a]|nr:S-adenosyl-L-methionine-dependent methyltransferase [Pyrenochaeta sp. DS3sAY3a]
MTQPTSVDMTFDTSLVDLNPNVSFSTTESDPSSDFGATIQNPASKTPTMPQSSAFEDQSQETPKQSQSSNPSSSMPPPKTSTPVQHIPTQDAYNQWASIYDSDGNMLQAIDDLELETILPDFLTQFLNTSQSQNLSILDLGCGTGRNTSKLISYPWPRDRFINITGLDFSRGMLDVANAKLPLLLHTIDPTQSRMSLHLECCDCFPTVANTSASPVPDSLSSRMHGIISTLVLEHIPLAPYFATLASTLQPNGVALVTNMHSEMGDISQAGFINAQGVKVRGSSFAHAVDEVVAEAQNAGFEVLSVKERAMTREDVESGRVGERGWKWVGVKVWYGIVVRKVGEGRQDGVM